MTTYYPIYVNLENQPCVVVGGGKIAEGKVEGLLAAGGKVTVISPDLTLALDEHVIEHRIDHVQREYRPGDLGGYFIVICATDRSEINHQVWEEACANRQLVNVVDDTPRCNFIAPAILRKGDLTIAVSTAGKAPALAVRLKERFQKELGPEYEKFLEIAGQLREPLAKNIPDFETRKRLWYQIVDSNVLDLLASGDEAGAREVISQVVGFHFEPA